MGGLSGVIESELIKAVETSAPLLASALGSPIAGLVLSLVAHTFGVDSNKVDELTSIVRGNPDAASKLKALELQHSETLSKISSSDYENEVRDRINARANAELYRDFLRYMAYFVTGGFFGILILMFIPFSFNPNQRELLSMLVGMLVSKWQTIIDFFYGSSHKQGGLK